MNPTTLSKKESPLLDDAMTKLRPGVFSHPVWVRFGNQEEPASKQTIKALFAEAENLQKNNPSDACQVLLLCAVFLNHSGQTENALTTLQEVQNIAHKNGLDREILWALWGACAICVQHKSFERAAAYLTSLKRLLSDQNDWMLADYIDVIKQTLLQHGKPDDNLQSAENRSTGNVLSHTFHWLNQWGFSTHAPKSDTQTTNEKDGASHRIRFNDWSSLRLLLRGELKVDWAGHSLQRGKRRSTFWGNILSLLHIEGTSLDQESASEIIDVEDLPVRNVATSIPEETPSNMIQEPEPRLEVPICTSVQMLGSFNLMIEETALNLPSSRSLSLLKYLLLNHRQNTPREMLLEIFWPNVSTERGRNNLNVAMNGIRTALRTVTDAPVILYKDNAYGIAPEIQFWMDVEEFERLVDSGRRLEARNKLSSAISDYEAAISLYQGDLLEENPYDNWTVLPRERLRLAYLTTLDRLSHIYYEKERYAMCITLSQYILLRDRCREDAHSMLMRCYSRQGQDHLALRQYQACVEALRLELDVTPTPETTKLYEQIRQHRQV